MNQPEEAPPARVTPRSKQAGEALRQRWPWVEPTVWNERMLATLERGVKGGQWFSLIDKVYAPRTLRHAYTAVAEKAGAGGSDGQSLAQFTARLETELGALSEEVRSGQYRPHPVRRVWIAKEGSREKRPLGIPAVRDRVVQTALRYVLEPIWEREFAPQSYGFRPGRSCRAALRRVSELLQAGYTCVVDADLKSYFDTIPHARLLARVAEKVSDGRVLELVESYLTQGVMTELGKWEPSESGTPQGAVICQRPPALPCGLPTAGCLAPLGCPLLANLYLHPLDLLMQQSGVEMVRYADDFLLLCRTPAAAQAALRQVEHWVQAEGLQLHPEKTRVVEMDQPEAGFDFLGYHFHHGGKRWPRRKSETKLRATLRPQTRRTNGTSLRQIIRTLNPILRGWYGYFRHTTRGLLARMDGWVRGRLRAILRRRQGRRGRSRRRDHQQWPNAYFARLGLFSLHEAQRAARQSHR